MSDNASKKSSTANSNDEKDLAAAAQAALNMNKAAQIPEGYNSVPYSSLTPEQIQQYAPDIDPNNPAAGMVAVQIPKHHVIHMQEMAITAPRPEASGPKMTAMEQLLEMAKTAMKKSQPTQKLPEVK